MAQVRILPRFQASAHGATSAWCSGSTLNVHLVRLVLSTLAPTGNWLPILVQFFSGLPRDRDQVRCDELGYFLVRLQVGASATVSNDSLAKQKGVPWQARFDKIRSFVPAKRNGAGRNTKAVRCIVLPLQVAFVALRGSALLLVKTAIAVAVRTRYTYCI